MLKNQKKNKYGTHVKPHLNLIRGWRRQGTIEEEIANRLQIAYSTFNKYKKEHKELQEALKIGLDESIIFAESKLMESIAEKNVTAIIFYLKCKAKYVEEKDKQSIKIKKEEIELKKEENNIEMLKVNRVLGEEPSE